MDGENIKNIKNLNNMVNNNNLEMGIGDWGLGIWGLGMGPIPNPQSPIPKKFFFINSVLQKFSTIIIYIK
jgi:hypothetical protein